MADPVSYGNPDRDIEQALVALKKGAQLIKYSRAGKPKFCPFRISPDETTLIWYSRGQERNLKLSSVQRIIPGQRTAVFKRYRRPDKEYLSFSLLYNNGERSLDLICKDKVEADVWLAGLNALTSTSQACSRRTKSDIPDFNDASSDITQIARPFSPAVDLHHTIPSGKVPIDLCSRESTSTSTFSDAGFERANMQGRTSTGDGFRISVSSTPSCSSQGSGPDDIESLGDVYVWGEVWSEGVSGSAFGSVTATNIDFLTPKPLESNVVLDVQQIACGVRHVALVTRQGEVFTWGEESGGRLGHGIEKNFSRPHLVEFLAVTNIESVACGEYHTCALSTYGDLYTWGDGSHNAGLLGHGSDVSHWIPKRVSGPLEGLQVLSIACGTWHSALATSSGKLFTFGDGTFGALGHGDRESHPFPREVQLFSGFKTIRIACGVWHTAAIIESPNQFNTLSRKLFTWGDGDKNRLGHGNKETYLFPTCVSSLVDYNFHQLACGHNFTIALTTSGHVFTMGSTTYGQLGNPQSDGKLPCLVQDKLVGEFVEEIACGSDHVAVLTSRNEVFTWGRGANGRLGHGDLEDRNIPTLVEALKDRHVKNIACGSNYTASICIHKWVSGADQSVCSGCRQAFGFTRKRHNCYNCGLVHCHACSSKKALKAALAPSPEKPHRVCDSCYAKLKKAAEAANAPNYNKKMAAFHPSHRQVDGTSRFDRGEAKTSRILLSPTTEPIKYLEVKSAGQGNSIVRASQVPSLQQLKDISFPSSLSAIQSALKPVVTAAPQLTQQPQLPQSLSTPNSRSSSPYARRPSPPRSVAPIFSRGVIDNLKKTNDLLSQEVTKLQNQVKSMKQKCELQDNEMEKIKKNAQEDNKLAEEKSSKFSAALEAFKSICELWKKVADELPSDISDKETIKSMKIQVESFLHTNGTQAHEKLTSLIQNKNRQQSHHDTSSTIYESGNWKDHETKANVDGKSGISQKANGTAQINNDVSVSDVKEASQQRSAQNGSRGTTNSASEGKKEVMEQFESGVYVTFLQFSDGRRIFKRVRFSKKRFAEQQAEEWWKENKDMVFKKYNSLKPAVSLPAKNDDEAGPST